MTQTNFRPSIVKDGCNCCIRLFFIGYIVSANGKQTKNPQAEL